MEKQFTPERIQKIVDQLEAGADFELLCREHKISTNLLESWKLRYGSREGLLKRLEELEEDNYKLKGTLADLKIQREAEVTGDLDRIYRILAANIPGTAITILDRDERYLLAEGDFLDALGYQKETMPGKKISEVITPENYHGYYKDVIRRAFEGETILVERQTLSSLHTQMKVVPLRDERAQIFAIMFVLIDITSIKQAEMQLTRMNEELELRVEKRTAELKAANKQLELFSYSVSHDLRAPLRSIIGLARILREDFAGRISDPDFESLSGRVVSTSLRMDALINDLLNFSRTERQAIVKAQVDVDHLVLQVLDELKREYDCQHFDFQIEPLGQVEAASNLLRQVWFNLLSNAIKYSMKTVTPVIQIKCRKENGFIQYSVSDNGAGFDMKFVDKLFGIFQRLHKSNEFEGTGVGLALVKSIINKHGGEIWAEAEMGKGATFYFSLPDKGNL